jgi:hypothetical protein
MDAATVLQEPNKRTFSFLTLTTGLLANLDYGTNHLRWMGELRFTLGAICEPTFAAYVGAPAATLCYIKAMREGAL